MGHNERAQHDLRDDDRNPRGNSAINPTIAPGSSGP
jgi:hypothetical protein